MDKDVVILKYLFDVQSSSTAIHIHLSGKSDYKAYLRNITVQRAVERELEIIGEAIGKLLQIDDSVNISYARLIVDLRNKIIHSYDSINNDVIWKIVSKDIPILQNEILNLINLHSHQA